MISSYIQPWIASVFHGLLGAKTGLNVSDGRRGEAEVGMTQAMRTTGENCVEASLTTVPGYAELERIVRADLRPSPLYPSDQARSLGTIQRSQNHQMPLR
jgi:hypothetical protein